MTVEGIKLAEREYLRATELALDTFEREQAEAMEPILVKYRAAIQVARLAYEHALALEDNDEQ